MTSRPAAGPPLAWAEPAGPVFPRDHRWPVTIEAAGVRLAPFRRRHRAEWDRVRERNADWLRPWDATPPDGISHGTTAEMIARLNADAKTGRTVPWVIRDLRAERTPLIGQCTLNNVTYGSALFASVGYWIDREWAGRGIMPVAVALAVDYAIKVMRLHRIEICLRPENAASLRVVEKLGFRDEGIRPRYIHIAGAWRDHRCFALDASEVGPGLLGRVIGGRR
ncbi:MAG: GNAT family N-acetyltransferase [Propionibacteriaceae bacterium]|nr:GNAT family N-acetyltransferase [Propionibacteriaceae bacterium]